MIRLDKLSQSECACVTSIQIKKQHYQNPRSPSGALTVSSPYPNAVLTSNTGDEFCLVLNFI